MKILYKRNIYDKIALGILCMETKEWCMETNEKNAEGQNNRIFY